MEVIIANRDPTEKDRNYHFIWWNISSNRFFKFISEKNGHFIWEHLKEITQTEDASTCCTTNKK